ETVETKIPYANATDQKRYEIKLTGQLHPKHSVVASYLDVDTTNPGNVFGNVVDLRSLTTRTADQKLKALHYNGLFADNLLIEGQYSEMENVFASGADTN